MIIYHGYLFIEMTPQITEVLIEVNVVMTSTLFCTSISPSTILKPSRKTKEKERKKNN